jgi:uncharacterized protein YcgL (UPF0745 family)
MVTFKVERFEKMGEKTGWTYIFIPQAIAHQLKPGCRKSYRVKGKLDQVNIQGLSLVPMGGGDFIIALKASLRKQLKKEEGATVKAELEEDLEFEIKMPPEMEMCLLEEPHLMDNFLRIPKSHQNYYINWFTAAKTEPTRVKRLTMIVNAMDRQLTFSEMLRQEKEK